MGNLPEQVIQRLPRVARQGAADPAASWDFVMTSKFTDVKVNVPSTTPCEKTSSRPDLPVGRPTLIEPLADLVDQVREE